MAIDCEDDTVYFTRGGGRDVAARIITRDRRRAGIVEPRPPCVTSSSRSTGRTA